MDDEDLAVERVARRVSQGGHHIPEATIRRRYHLGMKNVIKYYLPEADSALFLDNSIVDSQKVIARKNVNDELEIEDTKIREKMHRLANV